MHNPNGTALTAAENSDVPAENPTDPTAKPIIEITDFPTTPLIRGQGFSYGVDVDPKGVEAPNGWVIALEDSSYTGTGREIEVLRIPENHGVAMVTDLVPDDYWTAQTITLAAVLYRKDDDGNREEMARSETCSIPVRDLKVKGEAEFPTENIVAGKEYPFSVTLTNEEDVECSDVTVDIGADTSRTSDLYNFRTDYKITECPEGAVEDLEENYGIGNVYEHIRQINIPAHSTVRIAGTISFPEERNSVYMFFNFFGNSVKTNKFRIESASGGEGNDDQKPGDGTETTVLKDKDTGIAVSGVEKGLELSVKSVSKEQQATIEEKVKKLVEDIKGIKIFDISLLKEGKEVQPEKLVKVTIPLPEGFSTNVKLYHQNGQGVLEPVDITVKDSVISFEAKSFSPYVLADLGAKSGDSSGTKAPAGAKPANTTGSQSPKTGDASSVVLYLALALAAMGTAGFAMKRKMNR